MGNLHPEVRPLFNQLCQGQQPACRRPPWRQAIDDLCTADPTFSGTDGCSRRSPRSSEDKLNDRRTGLWTLRRPKPFNREIPQQFANHELLLTEIYLPHLEPARFDDRCPGAEIGHETAGINNYAGRYLPSTRTMGVPDNDKSCLRPENAGQIGGSPR